MPKNIEKSSRKRVDNLPKDADRYHATSLPFRASMVETEGRAKEKTDKFRAKKVPSATVTSGALLQAPEPLPTKRKGRPPKFSSIPPTSTVPAPTTAKSSSAKSSAKSSSKSTSAKSSSAKSSSAKSSTSKSDAAAMPPPPSPRRSRKRKLDVPAVLPDLSSPLSSPLSNCLCSTTSHRCMKCRQKCCMFCRAEGEYGETVCKNCSPSLAPAARKSRRRNTNDDD